MSPPKKASVISTFEDLKYHRQHVISNLRRAGVFIDSIEDWHVEDDQPRALLQERFEGCDLVVVLVALSRGWIPPDSNESLVETEYQAVQEKGIKTLVFMLDENAPWNRHLDNSHQDPGVQRWRDVLSANHPTSYFGLSPNSIDILPILEAWLGSRVADNEIAAGLARLRIARLLLSSPGDVKDEREAVSKLIFRFNQTCVEKYGLFIKLIKWEDLAPQIGPQPQEVIDKQIGSYDLFVGVMWKRFGTPTGEVNSGTEHEFESALRCWSKTRKPWITFYFSKQPWRTDNPDDFDQAKRVLEFRSHLKDKGIIRDYENPKDLEQMLWNDLTVITSNQEFLDSLGH